MLQIHGSISSPFHTSISTGITTQNLTYGLDFFRVQISPSSRIRLNHSPSLVKLILVASKAVTIYTDGKGYREMNVMLNTTDEFDVFSKQGVQGRETFQSLQWVQKFNDLERKRTYTH